MLSAITAFRIFGLKEETSATPFLSLCCKRYQVNRKDYAYFIGALLAYLALGAFGHVADEVGLSSSRLDDTSTWACVGHGFFLGFVGFCADAAIAESLSLVFHPTVANNSSNFYTSLDGAEDVAADTV